MADNQTNSSYQDRQGEGGRPGRPSGGRDQGGREPGGFRIRLSDNEMRAARALQEAFRLRSTVAVLGFALRTTAQLLEEGKLDALVEQQRSQAPERSEGRRGGDGPRSGRRDGRFEGGRGDRGPRVDPFARPSRPAAPQPAPEAEAEAQAEAVSESLIEAAEAAEAPESAEAVAAAESEAQPAAAVAEPALDAAAAAAAEA